MKKTYITQMPDKAGAFLAASRIISSAGGNITRVSYNKAVDVHLLFIEVSGDEQQHKYITKKLNEIGYTINEEADSKTVLVEFRLQDIPGAVLPVLELINRYNFNISYISSQENDTGFQNFKMGIFVSDAKAIEDFLREAAQLCKVRIIDYDSSQKILDNTVFYLSFASDMANYLNLSREEKDSLIADSNLVMQILDDRDESPYKTISYIGKFAELLREYKGDKFKPRVSYRQLKDGAVLHCIEPPCGSNTYVIEKKNRLMFIDSGFACYIEEMKEVLESIFSNFGSMEREIIITHPDIDHCGLLPIFRKVYVSPEAYMAFAFENDGQPNFREQNKVHAPYSRISKLLSDYVPPAMDTLIIVDDAVREDGGERAESRKEPIEPLGTVDFCGSKLSLYSGNGGHANGEVVIVDEENKLVFSGDITVNVHGYIKEQAEFNSLAPYLMTSVNMNSKLATEERRFLISRFSPDEYTYCCGHGAIMDKVEKST